MQIFPQDIQHSTFDLNGHTLSVANVKKLGPLSAESVGKDIGGVVINSPGIGKSIFLAAVASFSSLTLKENDDSGEIITFVAAGNYGLALPSPLKVKENTAIFSNVSTNISIFYYIGDA